MYAIAGTAEDGVAGYSNRHEFSYNSAYGRGRIEMAGSYDHVMDGFSLIENMGDAYEAVEELLWLVQSEIGTARACKVLNTKFYPMTRGEIAKDEVFNDVQNRMGK